MAKVHIVSLMTSGVAAQHAFSSFDYKHRLQAEAQAPQRLGNFGMPLHATSLEERFLEVRVSK